MSLYKKERAYYGGYEYRLFGWKYFTVWVLDYRQSTVVKSKLIVVVYSKLFGNITLIKWMK